MGGHISYRFKEFICLENCRIGDLDFNEGDSLIYALSDRPTNELKSLIETLVEQRVIIEVTH